MDKTMTLDLLSDIVSSIGYADHVIKAIQDGFYADHPRLRAVPENNALSTIPTDARVPLRWAHMALDSLGVSISDAKALIEGFRDPGAIPFGHPDRELLLEKVLEILPSPKSILRGERDRNVAGSPTVGKVPLTTQDVYEAKVEKITQTIMKSLHVGFRVVRGNSKIGKISQFSLPAGRHFRGAACPGATEFCESLCYAKETLFTFHEAQYYINWAYVLLWPDRFVDIWKELRLTEVVRIHVGGDFFSPDYADLWTHIIEARQDVRFYAYTRSWQDGRGNVAKSFLGPLRRLAKLKNMRLLLSVDHQTGIPPADLIPGAMRAWLGANDNDLPSEPLELMFRDKDGMGEEVVKVLANTPVCPVERTSKFMKKTGAVTCRNCSWCWSSGHDAYKLRPDDVSQFGDFSKRESGLGKWVEGQFMKPMEGVEGSRLGDSEVASAACTCGVDVPCAYCDRCAYCECVC
jgi:hypothetical protein